MALLGHCCVHNSLQDMFHLPGTLLNSEKLEVPLMNTNFTEWKGHEEQAQPRPTAAVSMQAVPNSFCPGRTSSHR